MAQSLAQKLQLKPGQQIRILKPPPGVVLDLPFHPSANNVLLFVETMEDLEVRLPGALDGLKQDSLLWVAYPKKSSPLHANIDRDRGWDALLAAGYQPSRLVSVDDVWSAMRFRKKQG